MDSGSSTGEIIGHSKAINAVAIRHQRPFRAATAADDNLIVFHQGAPYKFDKIIKTHTKFVQDVQYAPSGDHFASVGSDSKVFLYDGKTGDTIAELTASPHTGSIMAASWGPDSKNFVTSGADCLVALWDVQAQKPITTWNPASQHVGNAWSGERDIVSLSIDGTLSVFDPRTADKPSRVINAPQKAITAFAPINPSTFLGGTADGRVYSFTPEKGESDVIPTETHTNLVSDLASNPKDGNVYSVGYDDRLREIRVDLSAGVHPSYSASPGITTSSQPKSIAVAGDGTVFVVEINSVEAFRSNQRVLEHTPKSVVNAVAASEGIVALGGEDQKVRLNSWDGTSLTETAVLEGNKGIISALAFSPDGKLLASGDMITSRWSFHTARVNSLAWTSDSLHCASASLDTHVYVWSVAKPMKNIAIKNAAPGGANAVHWVEKDGSSSLATTGADGCVRLWTVTFHAS
ncbi:hypothetical protein H0H87_009496 [Tephrocybe sp. NHM501043]|nr:hypothetical protein H0H87_009496 [Tephrocybe sp. NHM501043]